MWRRGMQFGWVAANAPGTVGGRRAHPPKAQRIWDLKINKKERKKAIRSALSGAVLNSQLLIIEDKIENLKKIKDVKTVFTTLGLNITAKKIQRAGRGKSRGRGIKYSKNPLIVVAKKCDFINAVSNLPGYDVVDVKSLNEIETNQYQIGDKVFTVRLDMTLKVVLKYIRDSRRLEVYILPYSETPIYLSVANRGVTYNDEQVIKELRDQVLKLIWPNFSKEFRTDGTENTPSIAILIPENISDFGDEEAVITENNMETSSVGECVEGEEPQYYSDNGSGSGIALTKRTTLSRKSQVALKTIAKTMATAAVTSLPKPSVIVADVKEITPEEDPCSYLPEGEVLDNDIKDALCDFGLQDISFGTGYPNIIVDYEHGYIHFSTSLNPTPYDALWEEVSTND